MLSPESDVIYYDPVIWPISLDRVPLTYSSLKAFSKLKEYDVIINYDLSPITNLLLLLVSRLYKKRLILEVHDPYGLDRESGAASACRNSLVGAYGALRASIILRMPNIRVINGSDYLFLKNRGYKGKIYFIPILVALARPKMKANRKEFVCLIAGRLSVRQKGLDYLKEIVDKALEKNNKIKFHIVGSGDDGKPLVRELVRAHKGNVRWFGFAPQRTLRSEYSNSTAFLLTSRFEGSPAALVEAMSNGLVCVAFSIRGVVDTVRGIKKVRLVKPYDTDFFVDALLDLYSVWKHGGITTKMKYEISRATLRRYDYKKTLLQIKKMVDGR